MAAGNVKEFMKELSSIAHKNLGSMPVLEPQKMIEMIQDIAKTLNKRVIIASGWSAMTSTSSPLSDSLIMIQSANHGKQALDNEPVRQRAAEIGKRMKAEQGLKNALNWIENRHRLHPYIRINPRDNCIGRLRHYFLANIQTL